MSPLQGSQKNIKQKFCLTMTSMYSIDVFQFKEKMDVLVVDARQRFYQNVSNFIDVVFIKFST